jgi:hypothetical protein
MTETLAAMPLDNQTIRDLSRAAANVRTWTTKRNDTIRAAYEAGAGVREIARATGLNVATVHNILKPRSRGST